MKTKLLLYCPLGRRDAYYSNKLNKAGIPNSLYFSSTDWDYVFEGSKINDKIIAECDYEVEKLYELPWDYGYTTENITDYNVIEKMINKNRSEILRYLGKNTEGLPKSGYLIKVKNLKAYDTPKELSNLFLFDKNGKLIIKASKRMCKVREVVPFKKELIVKGTLVEAEGNRVLEYIFMPVKPLDLCRILNGEQTALVFKEVLKEMLK